MRHLWFIILAVALVSYSCDAQKKDSTNNVTMLKTVPKTNIKVNKEYDKDGNLIKYDSTYSYFYSNMGTDSHIRDSVFNEFMKKFNEQYSFPDTSFFNNVFFQDSLLKYDFFKNDFFIERFRHNQKQVEKIFNEMDSLKNNFFFKNAFPKK